MNRPKHYVVAVSGGVASGKSVVTGEFARLGVAVIDADIAARAVVAHGEPALAEIVTCFGTEVLDANGELNRKIMRDRVFADPALRKRLETIVHPKINKWLQTQIIADNGAYCILVIPLLAETWPDYQWVDRVLIVDVDENEQLSRLMQRERIDRELALQIIRAQANRTERAAIADDIIDNSGTFAELTQRVAALDLYYRELADRKRKAQ